MYNTMTRANSAVTYKKVAKRVNLGVLITRRNLFSFFFFSFYCIYMRGGQMLAEPIVAIISQYM